MVACGQHLWHTHTYLLVWEKIKKLEYGGKGLVLLAVLSCEVRRGRIPWGRSSPSPSSSSSATQQPGRWRGRKVRGAIGRHQLMTTSSSSTEVAVVVVVVREQSQHRLLKHCGVRRPWRWHLDNYLRRLTQTLNPHIQRGKEILKQIMTAAEKTQTRK